MEEIQRLVLQILFGGSWRLANHIVDESMASGKVLVIDGVTSEFDKQVAKQTHRDEMLKAELVIGWNKKTDDIFVIKDRKGQLLKDVHKEHYLLKALLKIKLKDHGEL